MSLLLPSSLQVLVSAVQSVVEILTAARSQDNPLLPRFLSLLTPSQHEWTSIRQALPPQVSRPITFSRCAMLYNLFVVQVQPIITGGFFCLFKEKNTLTSHCLSVLHGRGHIILYYFPSYWRLLMLHIIPSLWSSGWRVLCCRVVSVWPVTTPPWTCGSPPCRPRCQLTSVPAPCWGGSSRWRQCLPQTSRGQTGPYTRTLNTQVRPDFLDQV